MFDLVAPEARAQMIERRARSEWRLAHTDQSDAARHRAGGRGVGRAAPQAAADQGLRDEAEARRRAAGAAQLHLCKRARPDDVFRQFLERAKREGWRTFEIDASHNPHITAPDVLLGILGKSRAHDHGAADRHCRARPARQRARAPADRRGLRSEGLRHRHGQDRGVRARRAESAASLDEVARCDVVLLAVFDTDQVEDVVTNAVLPALTPGATRTVLCAATCDPDRIAVLIEKVAPLGLRMIETPVSGSSGQVRNGDGVGLIGGARDTVDSVADIIDSLYPKWFYMGAAGKRRARQARDQSSARPQSPRARRRAGVRASAWARSEELPRRGAPIRRLFAGDGHQGPEDGER